MKTALKGLDKVALIVLLVGGFAALGAMALGTADVVGTQFLGRPVPGALELTENSIVLIVFGGLSHAQIRRAHIRVEILYESVGKRMRSVMDLFADLVALGFFSALLWLGVGEMLFSLRIGEATVGLIRLPLWPARMILCLGTGLLILQLVRDIALDIRLIATGGSREARHVLDEAALVDGLAEN